MYPKEKFLKILTDEEITVILHKRINAYLRRGFRVISETNKSVQLVKPKNFSCLAFVILFCLGIIPGIIYYLICRDVTVHLDIDKYGKIKEIYR